jgi:hypothetical protein
MCGSNNTTLGTLFGAGFKPWKARTFLKSLESVQVWAFACRECGAVTLWVHPPKLAEIAEEPPTG